MALFDTVAGREILQGLSCWLAKRRMSRRFRRSFYRAFDSWKTTGAFSLETLENSLNSVDVAEIQKLNDLLVQLNCSDIGVFNNGVYHVNPTTGSDETGDGSDARPFASLAFFSSPYFPKYIDQQIRILIDGTVTADELCIDQVIGPNGSLSFVGVGNPVVVATSQGAGPFALTGATSYNAPIAAWEFNVAEVFGVNELYGRWIRFTTGDCAGQCMPIHQNTASGIFTRSGWNGTPAIADEFVVVDIASTIACPRWDIRVNGPTYGNDTTALSRFNMYNLNIDMRSASYQLENFRLKNTTESQISFCRIITDSGQFSAIRLESNLNIRPAADVGAAILASSSVANLDKPTTATNAGLMSYRDNFPPFSAGFSEVLIYGTPIISSVDLAGRLGVYGPFSGLTYVAAGQFRIDDASSGTISLCFFTPVNAATDAIFIRKVATLLVKGNYFAGGGLDIFSIFSGDIEIGENTYAVGNAGHGIRFEQFSARVSTRVSPAALTGATGDIYFAGGVGTTAHPVADAIATDGLGNSFAYISTP
jgi:hypothetical protein